MDTLKLNLIELDSHELKNYSGGSIILGIVIGTMISLTLACLDDPEGFNESFKEGYAAGSK